MGLLLPCPIDTIRASTLLRVLTDILMLVFVAEIQAKMWFRFSSANSNRHFRARSVLAEEPIDRL